MKKILVLLLAFAMCLSLLTGCKKNDEKNDGPIDDMQNPVKTYETIQGQIDATGLGLEAPENSTEVVYQSIEGMAETLFTYSGVRYFYRAEPTDKLEAYDISGLHYEWTETDSAGISGCDAEVKLCDEAGFIMWLDIAPGINYNLGTASQTSTAQLTDVANAVFAPVQGEVDEDIIEGLPWDATEFKSYDEQAAAAGFGLEAPEGATDVTYLLISGTIVQTLFKLDGVEYFYRAQTTGSTKAFDISGLYYDWKKVTSSEVKNREATVKTCNEAGFIMWLDVVPGINYNLGTSSAVSADKLTELADKVFVPIQNEEPGAICGMKNPVMTFKTIDDQKAYVGFSLEAPNGATEVYYQAIGSMAQTLFTLNGVDYFYRGEPCTCIKEYDMSGLNYKWTSTDTDQIEGITATAKTCKEAGFVMWLDTAPGINYNLGTSSKIHAKNLFELAKEIFVPVRDDEKYVGGLPNPLVELTSPEDQKELTGIGLKAPVNTENVVYLSIKGMPETRFTFEGTDYFYRATPTKSPVSFDISGLFYDWNDFAEGDVKGLKADASICDEAGFVMWLDKENGINYTLGVTGAVTMEKLFDTANIAYRPFGHEDDEPIANMKNPIVSFESSKEQAAVLGYGLAAPGEADDVQYFGIENMAETQFTLDGVRYFYRAQPTSSVEAVDISGLNYNWKNSETGTVRERAATLNSCDEAAFIMWLDVVPGITYNIGTVSDAHTDLFALAERLFDPLQEDDPTKIIGGMENPVLHYDSSGDQFSALGFALLAPEDAESVCYQSINGMAETIFVYKGTQYYYRAEPTGALECYDMSGIFATEWDEPISCSVKERDGMINLAEGSGVIMWFDPVVGFNYNLSSISGADGDTLLELANSIFVPLQGENEEDPEIDPEVDPEAEETVTEYASAEEQAEKLGLALLAPENAEDIRYQSVDDAAQTLFVLDSVEYCYRAKPTDQLECGDISGLFKEDDPFSTTELSVKECPAVFKSSETNAVMMWLDAVVGMNYNLFSKDVTDTDTLHDLAETVFIPLQGEADGE